MKKSIFLITGLILLLVVGCAPQKESNSETNKTDVSETKVEMPESKEFSVKGTYVVGEDIQPGTYYMVLTELVHGEDDQNQLTEVYINMADSSGKHLDTVYFSKTGEKKRVKLQSGETIQITDNGIEYDDFNLKFLNDNDFKKYTKENE